MTDDTETKPLNQIAFFPTTVNHPSLGEIRIVDYKRPFEYMDGVYAYEDADTGEYGGLIKEDNTPVEIISMPV